MSREQRKHPPPAKERKQDQGKRPKRKRGRPEKPLKIDDSPRNVARSFFGIKSTRYVRPE